MSDGLSKKVREMAETNMHYLEKKRRAGEWFSATSVRTLLVSIHTHYEERIEELTNIIDKYASMINEHTGGEEE